MQYLQYTIRWKRNVERGDCIVLLIILCRSRIAPNIITICFFFFLAGVIYTYPEVASVGAEEELKAGVEYHKGIFPSANSRARANGSTEGLSRSWPIPRRTRLGSPHYGTNAGEMIAEAVIAIEYGEFGRFGPNPHAHPTFE
jgi:pyruvate/2-oxoglutarate dehydrogenase complex dihydrolipoamide dehydrogenase (E3) component